MSDDSRPYRRYSLEDLADRYPRAARHAVNYALSLTAPIVAPSKRFVLFGTGRVGSELLMSLLDSHPAIVCDGEILTEETLLLPARFVEWRATLSARRRPNAYGFKVLTSQVRWRPHLADPHAFFQHMAKRGDLIVHMQRRNLLNVTVSFIQAEHVGWHHRTSSPVPSAGSRRLLVDPVEVLVGVNALSEAEQWNKEMLADIDHMTVVYEDDLEDSSRHQATVDAITSRLGLPSQPVKSDIVRVVPRSLRDRLANYDEVADLLSRTRFAHFLDDDASISAP